MSEFWVAWVLGVCVGFSVCKLLGTISFPKVSTAQIEPGQLYVLRSSSPDGDPFPPSDKWNRVKVLEVKPGWVRFRIGEVFPDERLTQELFNHCYRRIE